MKNLRHLAEQLGTDDVFLAFRLHAIEQRESSPVPPPELDDGAHFVTQK
jgi:hypothetical protein